MDYEYEFIFYKDFSLDIFNEYPEANDELKIIIIEGANKLKRILLNVNGRINNISSFENYNNKKYKITIKNN
jgi:hypothetical protein